MVTILNRVREHLIVHIYILTCLMVFLSMKIISIESGIVWGMMVAITFIIWSREELIFKSEAELLAMIEKPKGRWD